MKKFSIIYISIFILAIIICTSRSFATQGQIRVLVASVDVTTAQSGYAIYPNISGLISNDIINELNKNTRFNAPDLNSSENVLKSQGMEDYYMKFLKSYKDNGTINYGFCGQLSQKLGIDKLLLVSSGFSLQNMVLKQPLLYKIGITEVEPIKSFYQLNVETALIDTESCLVDNKNNFKKMLRADNFEIPTNSMNDNIFSTQEIKAFSDEISKETVLTVFTETAGSSFSRVRSNIVSTTNTKLKTRDGNMTRDGHSYSTNNEYLKNNRIEKYKDWVKNRVEL